MKLINQIRKVIEIAKRGVKVAKVAKIAVDTINYFIDRLQEEFPELKTENDTDE